MLSFRLGVLGRTLFEFELGSLPVEAPAIRLTLDTPTQSDGCFFSQTAEDVAWDTAVEGFEQACCEGDCDDEGDE